MWAVDPAWASASPLANEAPTTGIPNTSGANVPTIKSSRGGLSPWLKMITAEAPAASAFSALTANGQVPRWIRAMFPTGNPAKSAASQPLVDARGGTRIDIDRSHRCSHLTDSAPREGATFVRGDYRSELIDNDWWGEQERELVESYRPARRLQRVDDILDALGVAGRSRCSIPTIGIGDGLEGGLMLVYKSTRAHSRILV